MTTYERRRTILRLIQKHPGMRVGDLAQTLDVSEGTIRNDLNALEAEQLITRVRGGAVLKNGSATLPPIAAQARVNYEAKQRIARWAADMIEDGDSILLDASTTVLSIADFLTGHRNLTVITNGIEVARLLAANSTHTVILIGGVVRPDGSGITGLLGESLLNELTVKTAFVSCVGMTLESGWLEASLEQARIKARMLRAALRAVALVDSSKFGKPGLVPFAPVNGIAHVVTDDQIEHEYIDQLRAANVGLTVCGADTVDSYPPQAVHRKPYTIGFANLSEDIVFSVDVRRSVERAAKEANSINLILADNQLSGDAALTVADHLIARGVDLVIEYQIDEAVGGRLMDKFARANIPVIAIDIPMVGAIYFGVDNYRAGHMAGIGLGHWIEEHWGGTLDHLIVLEEPRTGALPAARIQGQLDGLQEVIGALPAGMITRADSGNTSAISEENVLHILRELRDHHRIGVISFNDDAALGALAGARRLGRESDIAIVGQGADRRMREEMHKTGTRIVGSTAYMPDRYGERLIDLAQRVLRHEPVPPAVYIEHIFITPENINLYYAET